MISTDFAPNEKRDDALTAFTLSFFPWKWKRGVDQKKIKTKIESLFPSWSSVLFFSGRSALFHLLKELHLPQKSSVLVQAFTCSAVVVPIIELQMSPVYIDIEPLTYSMDIKSLQSRVTSASKVVILQHSFGMAPKHRSAIMKLCEEKSLILIEDLSHGYESVRIQNNRFISDNHFLLLSFGRSKSLSSVFGGAVLSKKTEFIHELNRISSHLPNPSYLMLFRLLLFKMFSVIIQFTYELGVGKILFGMWRRTPFFIPELSQKEKRGKFDFHSIDYSFSNAQAILLQTQLENKSTIDRQRINRSTQYQHLFHTLYSLTTPLIRFPLCVLNRKILLNEMKKNHIFLGTWYSQPVVPKEVSMESVLYQLGSCPVAEEICSKIVNFPTSISQAQADKIIALIKKHI